MLGQQEVLLAQYLLFAESAEMGRYSLLSLILFVSRKERLAIHNWGIAQLMDRADLLAHGAAIAALDMPLFPPNAGEECAALNTRMLRGSDESVSGGSAQASQAWTSAFFSESASLLPGRRVTGAGYAPVGQLQDGSWAADTSAAEAAAAKECASLRRQVVALERRLVDSGGQVRRSGRGQAQQYPAAQQYPQQQQHPQQQQQQYLQQQQQQQPQHYTYRARGRGGGRGARGGGLEEQETAPLLTPVAETTPAPAQASAPKRWDPSTGVFK